MMWGYFVVQVQIVIKLLLLENMRARYVPLFLRIGMIDRKIDFI